MAVCIERRYQLSLKGGGIPDKVTQYFLFVCFEKYACLLNIMKSLFVFE